MPLRVGAAFVAAAATAVASLATAQEWSVQSGATARVEYNDNYFFTSVVTQSALTGSITPVATQSAFTGTLTPFVTAARRTEASDVTALVAVGANKVWRLSPTVDYLSGRFGLDGSLREARSTWTGSASFVRSAPQQSELTPAGAAILLGLAYTNAASAKGGYTYALTERWSLGTTAGAYSNRYDSVDKVGTLSNNRGYYAGGNAGYAYSDRTQFTFTAGYSHYISNVTRSDEVTTTIGVVHQVSPQLTISASVGGFWSDIEVTQSDIVTGNRSRDRGELYGGNISYAFSERTQFVANLSENLLPSSSGSFNKTENAGASLTHRFSDRLTGRLGASYTRTIFPAAISSSSTNNYYLGEIGFSYLLAERWKLDAGYQYARARYEQIAGEPKSNLVFVSIGYNWPGASFTDWVGRRPDTQGLPGAGAVSLPVRSPGSTALPGVPPAASPPEASPFDRLTIP
jgi:hypothetical protein